MDNIERLLSPRSDVGDVSDEHEEDGLNHRLDDAKPDVTDVRYLMPAHMPQYLRIDQDVKEGLLRLTDLMRQYSNFDVLALERDVTRTLELELDK